MTVKEMADVMQTYENVEPDCTQCVHFNLGKDKRDITCNDCKWNYCSQFELEENV